jgi:hypothetical protein
MKIPLRAGRLLDEGDMEPAPFRPVLINEALARRAFAGRDPIGRHIRAGGLDNRPFDVVVGVVGDVKQTSLAAVQSDALYATTGQWLWPDNPLWLVVRTSGDAAHMAPAIKKAVWSVDKDQPINRVSTMDAVLAHSAVERRFALVIFEAFALVALALAAVGVYGALAGIVSERMREIGVRAAFGASRERIFALIVREGLAMTAIGATIGLLGATAASRVLVALLYGVTRLDAVTYIGVVALLLGVSAIASWIPAWRAARIDPAITLRAP